MTDDISDLKVAMARLEGSVELVASNVQHIVEGMENRTEMILAQQEELKETNKKVDCIKRNQWRDRGIMAGIGVGASAVFNFFKSGGA